MALLRRASSGRPDRAEALQGALGWTALVAVLGSALLLGANKPVSWTALAGAAWVLFAIQLALDLFGPGAPRRSKGLALPGALYFGVLLWGSFQLSGLGPAAWTHPAWLEAAELQGVRPGMAIDPVEGRHVLMRLAAYPMLFWIAFRAAVKPARAVRFINAVAVWATLLAAFGIAAAITRVNPILEGVATQRQDVVASFVNSNSFAFYAGLGMLANVAALIFAFDRAGGHGGRARRLRLGLEAVVDRGWIFLLGAGVTAAALTLTGSRAGVASSLLGAFALTAIMFARREGRGLGGAQYAALAAFLLIALYAAASGFLDVFEKAMSTRAAEGRVHVYPRILAAIAERPWLGAGPGGFSDGFRAHVPIEAATGDWLRAHNSFLENAYEFGVPAAAAFYAAIGLVLLRIWRGAMSRRRMIAAPAFAVAIAVAGAAHSLVDFSLQMPATAALFAMCLGVGYAQSFSSRRLHARAGDDTGGRASAAPPPR